MNKKIGKLKAIVIAFALVFAGFAALITMPTQVSAAHYDLNINDNTNTTATITTGDDFTFDAMVKDNWAVTDVYVNWSSDTTVEAATSMSLVSGDNWSATITVPSDAHNITYKIAAHNWKGEWNETTYTTLTGIVDNDAPSITLTYEDDVLANTTYTATAEVTDNRDGVDAVWIQYSVKNVNETGNVTWDNQSYTPMATIPIEYHYNITLSENATWLWYEVWANDTVNNSASVNTTFDGSGPLVEHTEGAPTTGEDYMIEYSIAVNFFNFSSTELWYNVTSYTGYYMSNTVGFTGNSSTGINMTDGMYHYTIPVWANATNLDYEIRANDTEGQWMNNTYSLAVTDNDYPTATNIEQDDMEVDVGDEKSFNVNTSIADNLGKGQLNYTWWVGGANLYYYYFPTQFYMEIGYIFPESVGRSIFGSAYPFDEIFTKQHGESFNYSFPRGFVDYKVILRVSDDAGNEKWDITSVSALFDFNLKVQDSEGDAIEDASVKINAEGVPFEGTTDSNGEITFYENMGQTNISVSVGHPDYEAYQEFFEYGNNTGSASETITLTGLTEWTLNMGPVKNEENYTVPGAEVVLSNGTDSWNTTTDASGNFAINVPFAPYGETFTLTITHPDYKDWVDDNFTIPAYEDRADLYTTYEYILEEQTYTTHHITVGPVQDEDGDAVESALVSLMYDGQEWDNMTGADGNAHFHVTMEEGMNISDVTFDFEVTHGDFEDYSDSFIGTDSGAVGLTSIYQPTYTISVGPVKDVNGKLVEGADVTVTYTAPGDTNETTMSGTTGANGMYTFDVEFDPSGVTYSYSIDHDDLDEPVTGTFDGTDGSGAISSDDIGEKEDTGGAGNMMLFAGIGIVIIIIIIVVVMMMMKKPAEGPMEEEFEEDEFVEEEIGEEEELFEEEEEEDLFGEEEDEELFEEEEEFAEEEGEEELFEEEEEEDLFDEEEEL